jgi:serine/threonine-protein phosphatase 2B catalytic subunit
MTSFFNFRTECIEKYDLEIYDLFMDAFDTLPLACVVNGRFMSVHGGISPDIRSLGDINSINRFSEPPKSGMFCDMIWSDPVDSDAGKSAKTF